MPLLQHITPLAMVFALLGSPARPQAAQGEAPPGPDGFAAYAQEAAFAKEIETRIAAGDLTALDMDIVSLVDQSTRDIDIPAGELLGVVCLRDASHGASVHPTCEGSEPLPGGERERR